MSDRREPVIILAGGKGMRLREYTETLPKALIPIGPFPIILHVMKIYAASGRRNFIICLGYRGELIKEYFMAHEWRPHDFRLSMGISRKKRLVRLDKEQLDFEITFAETGMDTPTGGRLKKAEKYVETDNFHVTYCDGVADIDVNELSRFHLRKNKIGTVTAVHAMSPFGIVEINQNGTATSFKEKPALPGYINGGFLMFKKDFFDFLTDESILEEDPLKKLTSMRQLAAFKLEKFWACMDTFKDVERLNTLWEKRYMPNIGYKGRPPWVRE